MPSKSKPDKNAKTSVKKSSSNGNRNNGGASANGRSTKAPAVRVNQYGIPDWRLEHPEFEVIEVTDGPEVHYEVKGKLTHAGAADPRIEILE